MEPAVKGSTAVLNSGIEFGFDPFYGALIADATDWKYKEAKERRVDCSDRYYCCGRIAITGDFNYLDGEFVKLLYSVSRNSRPTCSLDDGKTNIVFIMYMNKVDVLINKINPIVTAIIEAGL
jgi:hypothetical protein